MQPQQHWTKGDNNFFWSVSHSNVGEYAVCLLHAVGTLFIHIQFDLKYFSAGLLTHQSVPTCTAAWGYSAWGIQLCISPSWATCGFQHPNWPVVVHMLRQRYVKKKQNKTKPHAHTNHFNFSSSCTFQNIWLKFLLVSIQKICGIGRAADREMLLCDQLAVPHPGLQHNERSALFYHCISITIYLTDFTDTALMPVASC